MKNKQVIFNASTNEYNIAENNIDNEELKEFQSYNILQEIEQLKQQLFETDYKCLKYVDGALTEDEYKSVREYRQTLRDKINELEAQL